MERGSVDWAPHLEAGDGEVPSVRRGHGVAGVQLGRLREGRAGISGGGSTDRGRAGGDRYCRAGQAVAVAGRARPANPTRHPELGHGAGAHRGLAALDSVPPAADEVLWRVYLEMQTMGRVTQTAKVRQPYPNLRQGRHTPRQGGPMPRWAETVSVCPKPSILEGTSLAAKPLHARSHHSRDRDQ